MHARCARGLSLLCFGLALSSATLACATVRFISPYDQVIDEGLMAYRQQINVFVKDLADKSGKPDGTFDANKGEWNSLQTKIDGLVERAKLQGGERACKLPTAITERMLAVGGASVPVEVKAEAQASQGTSEGCTVRLLSLIRVQLDLLMQIHRETDKCTSTEGTSVSCLRSATAKDALQITNQSINAAWVVETAKKRGEDS